MGCRGREFPGNENPSFSPSEALLLATMCIIGLPVDVHVKDGSVYSGIFHTASVENDYGIVLKKARMTRKGKCNSNIVIGEVIDTLVILSGDFVQLVAKGLLLPADCYAGNLAHSVPSEECPMDNVTRPIESAVCRKNVEQIRSSIQNENGLAQGLMPTNTRKDCEGRNVTEIKETSGAAKDGRQFGHDGLQGDKSDDEKELEFTQEDIAIEVVGSSSSSDTGVTQIKPVNKGQTDPADKPSGAYRDPPSLPLKVENHYIERTTSADSSSCVVSSSVSTLTSLVVDVTSESCCKSVATSTETAPPHFSQSNNRSAKEFKLNPGAKIFSPSSINSTSTPPIIQTVAGSSYMPNHSSAVPVPASHVPVKILPYGNFPPGNVATVSQFPQPIVGHVGNRTQPLRFAGQYPVQAGSGIVHPNSRSVMVGRLSQPVYVHPVSQELVQGVTAISSPFARPLSSPHQAQFPKHQGTAAGQAMQHRIVPPLIASGEQPYAVPLPVPIMQPPFLPNRYVQVPGYNGLLNSKVL